MAYWCILNHLQFTLHEHRPKSFKPDYTNTNGDDDVDSQFIDFNEYIGVVLPYKGS